MKHPLLPTITILLLFVLAQVIGILVVIQYLDKEKTEEIGKLSFSELPFGQERPHVAPNISFLYITIAVLIGTALLLLLIKFKLFRVWKFWFLLAIGITLLVSFAAFINEWIALVLAAILAVWRMWKPNIIIHNLTEIFIYAGIAAMFAPIMNLFAGSLLLIVISLYDYWAVFHSKHMIKLAEASTNAKIFPGLHIEYHLHSRTMKETKAKETKTTKNESKKPLKKGSEARWAVLGGGDIAFTLLFAAAVLTHSYFQPFALLKTGFVIGGATLGLATIFLLGKKDKFYPAMPMISLGCFLGFAATLLV